MTRSVMIAELAWPEYDRLVRHGKTTVLLPIGALEQHGHHMSMNPDVLLPTAMAERVARSIDALVAPPIAYGYKSQQKSGGGNHMPGTTSLDGLTLTSMLKDVLKEFARHGVRKVAMVNGHFENSMFIVEGVDLAIRELRWEGIKDFSVVVLSYWDFVTDETIRTIYPRGHVEGGRSPASHIPALRLLPDQTRLDTVLGMPVIGQAGFRREGQAPAGGLRRRNRARAANRFRPGLGVSR